MTPRQRRNLIIASVTVFAIAGGYAIIHSLNRPTPPQGQKVQKSINEILEERSKQAQARVSSPLGQAFFTKNWAEFDRLYQPQSQFNEFAEVIRSGYIQNQFKDFSASDFDEVFSRVTATLKSLDPKVYPQLGLFISQFNRLPTPQKESESFKTLLNWMHSDKPLLKRLAILKLTAADSNPNPEAIKSFIQGYTGQTYGLSRLEWVRTTDEIRNISAKKACIQALSKVYPTIESAVKPHALVTLGHEPSIETSTLVRYTLQAIEQDDGAYVDAALKNIPLLIGVKALTPAQISKISQRMDSIPQNIASPFTYAKIREIRQLLQSNP